jgi:hypothetical protein
MDPRIARKHSDPVYPAPDLDPQHYFVTVCGVDVRVTKFIMLKFKDSNFPINIPYGNNTKTAAYVVAVIVPISLCVVTFVNSWMNCGGSGLCLRYEYMT